MLSSRLLITSWASWAADAGEGQATSRRPQMQPFYPRFVSRRQWIPRKQQTMRHRTSHISEAKKSELHKYPLHSYRALIYSLRLACSGFGLSGQVVDPIRHERRNSTERNSLGRRSAGSKYFCFTKVLCETHAEEYFGVYLAPWGYSFAKMDWRGQNLCGGFGIRW